MNEDEIIELLDRFQCSQPAREVAKSLLQLLLSEGKETFEKAIVEFSERIIRQDKSEQLKGKEIDEVYTLLDVYCSEQKPKIELSTHIDALLLEGQHFHHLGDQAKGPDIDNMKDHISQWKKETE